jgi:exopolysaccharide biosynthesis polyprenyl glycosylphosphotransferase
MLKRHWRSVFIGLAIVADSLVIGIAGLIASYLRHSVFHLPPVEPVWLFALVVYSGTFLIGIALILGLYRASFHTDSRHQYALALKAYILAVPAILTSFYFLHWFQLFRIFTFLFFAAVPVTFLVGRMLLRQFASSMRRIGYGVKRVLLVDQGGEGQFIFRRYDVLPDLGYDPVCVIHWNGSVVPHRDYHQIEELHCETVDDLKELLRAQRIEQVLMMSTESQSVALADMLRVCTEADTKLMLLSQETEDLLRFVYVTDIAGIPLYSPPRYKVAFIQAVIKRAFDIISSSLLIVLFSPVILLSGLAILIESGFPIFFTQRRSLLKGGKEFDFYKFRSMVKEADQLKESLYGQNESDGALFKIRRDPRITKVGRLIRRYSIDELPQLFNVLKGDMGLVGPRPLPLQDFEKMNGSAELWATLKGRDSVKPGITGLWQISGRSNLGFREMVLLDFYYIENQSIFFDLEILLATIPVVLFGRGAY